MDRPHVDRRVLHVDPEHGQALVLGHVGVGAGQQQAEIGVLGAAGPHLLAVDDPIAAAVAGLDRPGAGRRRVGAARRLAEQLAPDLFAAQGRADKALFVLFIARCHHRGHAHAKADGEWVAGGGELGLFLGEHLRLPGGAADAAPLLGPGDARIACGRLARLPVLGFSHRRFDVAAASVTALGRVGLEPGAGLGAVFGFFRGVVEIHDQNLRILWAALKRRCAVRAGWPAAPSIASIRRPPGPAAGRGDRTDGSPSPR